MNLCCVEIMKTIMKPAKKKVAKEASGDKLKKAAFAKAKAKTPEEERMAAKASMTR